MFDRTLGHVMGRPSRFIEDIDSEILPTAELQEESENTF